MRSTLIGKSAAAILLTNIAGWLPLESVGLLLVASSPASAQSDHAGCVAAPSGPPREIRPGMCVRSSIGANDPKNADGTPYEDWLLRLDTGQTVQIDMDGIAPPRAVTSPQTNGAPDRPAATQAQAAAPLDTFGMDTFLELRRPDAEQPLLTNDDRPGSLNSRIRFTALEGGNYIIRARPLFDEAGDYELRVSLAPPPPPPVRLADGQTPFQLGPDSPRSEAISGYGSAPFAFDGSADERVRIAVESSRPFLAVSLADGTNRVIARTRTTASKAVLIASLPSTGHYQLLVEAPTSEAQTNLTIRLDRRTTPTPSPTRIIHVGETLQGELGLDSNLSIDPYGTGFVQGLNEIFAIAVRPGEPVTILLESAAFDPVLDAGAQSAIGFAIAVSNDDGGGGLNSQLVLRPTRAGIIFLRVRSIGNGSGPFRISVSAGEPQARRPG